MAKIRNNKIQRKSWAVGCYAQNCFRRSANRTNANNVWNVNTSGNVNTNNAYNANRCAPRLYGITTKRLTHSASATYLLLYTEPNALPQG